MTIATIKWKKQWIVVFIAFTLLFAFTPQAEAASRSVNLNWGQTIASTSATYSNGGTNFKVTVYNHDTDYGFGYIDWYLKNDTTGAIAGFGTLAPGLSQTRWVSAKGAGNYRLYIKIHSDRFARATGTMAW
ncbi:hypothetical protein ACEOWJ_002044 [Bacillus cereus]